mgnify:CR=1 FL=1
MGDFSYGLGLKKLSPRRIWEAIAHSSKDIELDLRRGAPQLPKYLKVTRNDVVKGRRSGGGFCIDATKRYDVTFANYCNTGTQ